MFQSFLLQLIASCNCVCVCAGFSPNTLICNNGVVTMSMVRDGELCKFPVQLDGKDGKRRENYNFHATFLVFRYQESCGKSSFPAKFFVNEYNVTFFFTSLLVIIQFHTQFLTTEWSSSSC